MNAVMNDARHAADTPADEAPDDAATGDVLGRSRAIQEALATCLQVARADATVLLLGETGTGKEMLARLIHEHSGRRGSYVAINCGAVNEALVESELFGHVKGAFTGASMAKVGLFREADHGTLLLDEIGLLPSHAQHSLLRVLQEGRVRPVGATHEAKVDVRVIAATSVSLVEAVERGEFRTDLFYRLDVIRIVVPPLRRRGEDILTLFHAFNQRLAERHRMAPLRSTPAFEEALLGYSWPGNVRQLENLTERLLLTCAGETLSVDHFQRLMGPTRSFPREEVEAVAAQQGGAGSAAPDLSVPLKDYLERAERAYLSEALHQTRGHVHEAARLAGLSRRTLSRKIKKFDLHREDPPVVRSATPPTLTWLCAPPLRPCRLDDAATELTLGRAQTCDFVFPLPGISRVHLRLLRRGSDWLAEDVGSSNGTLLNGAPLEGCAKLAEGDLLVVDALKFRVVRSPVEPAEHSGVAAPLLRGQLSAVALSTLITRVRASGGHACIDVVGAEGSGSIKFVDGELLWATFAAREDEPQCVGAEALACLRGLRRGMFVVSGQLDLEAHDVFPVQPHVDLVNTQRLPDHPWGLESLDETDIGELTEEDLREIADASS